MATKEKANYRLQDLSVVARPIPKSESSSKHKYNTHAERIYSFAAMEEEISHFRSSDIKITTSSKSTLLEQTILEKDEKLLNLNWEQNFQSEQSELVLAARLLSQNKVLSNERWDGPANILFSRIIKFNKENVWCECILDKEESITQIRKFNSSLFSHIQKKASNLFHYPIVIKINQKAGSIRIDIVDGSNMGIEKEFDSFVDWSELSNFKSTPL